MAKKPTYLLYIYDSTSPVLAAEHFRRSATSARATFQCDDWLGSAMAFEQQQQVVVYWWSKSHIGHLPEGAADALAKDRLHGDAVPVPAAYSRHVSLRFYAKGSERTLALAAANLDLVRRHLSLHGVLRPTRADVDALRAARLCARDELCIRMMRADRAELQVCRAYPDTGPASVGAFLFATGCPCGGGPQDRRHVTWHCTLPGVVAARERLLAAAVTLDTVLGECEPVTKLHQVSRMSCEALREGRAPTACSATAALSSSTYSEEAAHDAALRHLLGIVRRPDGSNGLMRSLKCAKPMLRAMVAIQHAAESATREATAAVVRRCLTQRWLRDAFAWVRQYTWLHPLQEHPTLAPAAAAARNLRVASPPRRRLPQAHVIRHSARLPHPSPVGDVVRAQLVSSPLAAAAWVLPLLARKRRVRDESLHRMDAQLRRVAGASVRDAECEAVAAQIVLDALPQARDVPPVVFPPSVRRQECCLPPLAQLHNAKDRSPATLARLSRRGRPLPSASSSRPSTRSRPRCRCRARRV